MEFSGVLGAVSSTARAQAVTNDLAMRCSKFSDIAHAAPQAVNIAWGYEFALADRTQG